MKLSVHLDGFDAQSFDAARRRLEGEIRDTLARARNLPAMPPAAAVRDATPVDRRGPPSAPHA